MKTSLFCGNNVLSPNYFSLMCVSSYIFHTRLSFSPVHLRPTLDMSKPSQLMFRHLLVNCCYPNLISYILEFILFNLMWLHIHLSILILAISILWSYCFVVAHRLAPYCIWSHCHSIELSFQFVWDFTITQQFYILINISPLIQNHSSIDQQTEIYNLLSFQAFPC